MHSWSPGVNKQQASILRDGARYEIEKNARLAEYCRVLDDDILEEIRKSEIAEHCEALHHCMMIPIMKFKKCETCGVLYDVAHYEIKTKF